MFTDTHCHISKEYYKNIDEIINNANEAKVTRLINNGTDIKSNLEVLELIAKYPNVFGAIGIHPETLENFKESDLTFIEKNINKPKIIAIGEIGLDYHYTENNKEEQIKLFKKQLELAEKYHKPVIIHSREATLDTINILKDYNVTGIIHSFSGSLETAKIYIKMGYLLGINGVITFKNCKLKDVIQEIPLEKIVFETDSPYLTPSPYRGTTNEPAKMLNTIDFVCKLKNITREEISIITNKNITRIFDI